MINVVKEIKIDIDKSNGVYLKKYDSFTPFVLGYSKVIKDNRVSYIDIYGNHVILSKEQLRLINEYSTSDDKSYLHLDIKDGKYGYVNSDNEVIIDYKYDSAREFSDGLARIVENRKYGFIDEQDNVVIKPKYNYASSFENGISVVREGKWGIIDKTGRILFPCIASEVMDLGYNRVYIDGYMYDLTKIKLKHILIIDIDGNVVKREFDSKSEIENYEKILYSTISDIVKKCDNKKIKKLTIDNKA